MHTYIPKNIPILLHTCIYLCRSVNLLNIFVNTYILPTYLNSLKKCLMSELSMIPIMNMPYYTSSRILSNHKNIKKLCYRFFEMLT